MNPGSLYCTWKPVTVTEMKAFIAIILNMGIIQMSDLKDYWSTGVTTNLPFFRAIFSRNRFFQIYGNIHCCEINGKSNREKIQPFQDLLLPTFQSSYTPHQQVAIDESVISFKGRVSCLQYLKGKPHPWGIKAFVLPDSKTGYLYNIRVYYGQETDLLQPELPHTIRAVLTLVDGLENKGFDLYVDRFYNSPQLALELHKIGITVTGKKF